MSLSRPGRAITAAYAWFRQQSAATRFLLVLGLLGYLARVAVMAVSDGSTDFRIWRMFGTYISHHSLLEAYVDLDGEPHHGGWSPLFNHPPLPALLSVVWFKLSNVTPLRFSIWLKLPGLCAEVLSGVVLAKLWSQRQGTLAGAKVWAAYGWSLCSILVSAYHANTDASCAAFCLLAVYLLEAKQQDYWGGLALAAAINVKVIPVLLILPLLANYRVEQRAVHFLAGLATGALPFLWPLAGEPRAFFRNVFGYIPAPDFWGIQTFLLTMATNPRFGEWAKEASTRYTPLGRMLIPLCILGFSAAIRWRRSVRWTADEIATVGLAVFLLLAPGFGLQYVILLAPLLFTLGLREGNLWAWFTGLMLLEVYASWWVPGFPWTSYLHGRMPFPGPLLGLFAWGLLGIWTFRTLQGRRDALGVALPQR